MTPREELEALWQQTKEERARRLEAVEAGASITAAYARGEEEGWTALGDIDVDERRATSRASLGTPARRSPKPPQGSP